MNRHCGAVSGDGLDAFGVSPRSCAIVPMAAVPVIPSSTSQQHAVYEPVGIGNRS